MESNVNYTLVGIFVLVLGVALALGVYWLSAGRHPRDYTTYMVYMNEAVSGLSEQAPVKFNGVNVGYVSRVELNFNNPQQVILLLNIEENTPVNMSTTATLMAQGVTGITYVGLSAKKAKAPLLTETPGQPYPVIKSAPSLLVELDTALREVTTNIEGISTSFSHVFDKENTTAIKKSLENLQAFTETLAKNSSEISESIKDANLLLSNTSQASVQFPRLVSTLQSSLESVDKMTKTLSKSSDQFNLTLRDSRSAVQNISQQTLPAAGELISRLDSVATNLQSLSQALRRNPSMLVRGQLPPSAGPGE